MGYLKYVCLIFAEDKLADFEGLLRTIRPRSGPNWATEKIRWTRRNRNRLRSLMREHAAVAGHPSVDRVRALELWANRANVRRDDLAGPKAPIPHFRGHRCPR
ncbi:hypothetical protein ElP_72860 (plasmid) [Tautonia plasticadhaerens]|uniref:Uncharacterized protein n=1 Tax=Tautonia plasticadhaerens TaxID=2527974 RepID=A0A518HER8_9BACT|nr:hypothetical protein ElP_72860 [Tautonia plasticadhaerens]